MFRKIAFFVIIALCLSGCAAAPEETIPPDTSTPTITPAPSATQIPPTATPEPLVFASSEEGISVVFDNLFPEGIEFDENGERFLLGSMSEHTVYQVFDDGTIEPLIEDPDLIECVGLEIDRNNNRLLVVNNDEEEGKSYLNSYDLVSGERLFISEISSIVPDLIHAANDVAVDADGNAYVTDFASTGGALGAFGTSSIYRVDLEGNPALFMEHSRFNYLNGIVYHPQGFLLLGSYPGLLLKIPIENPELNIVEIPEGDLDFMEIDGMVLHPDGTLIMVTYPDSIVDRLQSDDGWETAQTVGVSEGHAAGYGTTIALRGEEAYIIYSHLDRYQDGFDQSTFEIVHVIFE